MISQVLIAHTLAFTLAFILAFCTLPSLQAQTAAGSSTAPDSAATATGTEAATDLPGDAALLREHLAQGDQTPPGQANMSQPLQKARPGLPGASAPNTGQDAGQGARQDAREEGGVANAVKDFVRPLHQEISNSSVVQVVREIDAAVSGTSRAERAQAPPGTGAPDTEPGTRALDPRAAALMWQELLEEIVPWAVGGGIIALLGYGGYFWLKVVKFRKKLKHDGKHHEGRMSHRGFSRASARLEVVGGTQPDNAASEPVTRVRKSSSGGAGRSSGRGPSSEPGRSSSRSSSSSPSRTARHEPGANR